MLIVARGDIALARPMAFGQNCINGSQAFFSISGATNRTWLKFNLGPVCQFHGFQRAKHAMFVNCVYCFHPLCLPQS